MFQDLAKNLEMNWRMLSCNKNEFAVEIIYCYFLIEKKNPD